MSSVSPSAKMKSEFGWLIAAAMVVMIAITLFLCALQYHRERVATLEVLEASAGERVLALNALLSGAVRPITALRQAAQDQGPNGAAVAPLLERLAPTPTTLSFEAAPADGTGTGSTIASAARPDVDPGRHPVWSPVYQGKAPGSVMAAYAEPVYHDERFIGVAAAEIALTFLHQAVEMPDLVGQRLVLVDRSRHVLVDSWLGSSNGHDATLALGEVLPATLVPDEAITAQPAAASTQVVAHGYTVLVVPLTAAPWLLVMLVPEGALFLHIVPWLGVTAVLIAGMFILLTLAQFYLSRRFIRPAQALVRLVTAEASGQILPPQRVPSLWQPWFARVTGALAASRAQLIEAEAFRGQVAALLRDGVAQPVETQCPGPEDSTRRIAWSLAAGTDDSGAITHVIATGHQIAAP